MPERIRLSRAKGWRKPEGAVVVSRPSTWGNPWRVGGAYPWDDNRAMTAADAVEVYRYAMDTPHGRSLIRAELAGKDLACWCPLDQPCHADVLLELANSDLPHGADDCATRAEAAGVPTVRIGADGREVKR